MSPCSSCIITVTHRLCTSLHSISILICHRDKSPLIHWASLTRDFWAKSCGKTEISLSATLHCWVWTNEVTTAAQVTQWQTAYSATSSVAAPQGPGSDLFPELHPFFFHPLFSWLSFSLTLLICTQFNFPSPAFSYSYTFSF